MTMILINDIYINTNGDKLVIDAATDDLDTIISHIYIDTQDTYLTTGPSDDRVYEHEVTKVDAKDDCNSLTEDENVRKMRIEIPQEDICASLRSNFFIVYIEDGDGNIVIGTALWMRPIFNSFLHWIREINQECELPRHFIYLHLQYQALILAVRTCNLMEAIKIYNKYFHRLKISGTNFKGCSCRR